TDPAFVFDLDANPNGNLLKIVRFDNSAHPKILIDLTNQRKYTAVSVADTLWFELEPSATRRSLVLTTLNTGNSTLVRQVNTLAQKNFINFGDVANQGNYLIISNKKLYNDNGNDRVEEYRAYRSSTEGGNYNARVYDIDELTEQFAYNIPKHPLAIRNFLRYARTTFNASPKAVFLLGRGATYDYSPGAVDAEFLNLVPTWGHPASDNLLAAENNENVTPATPIGRLGAITGAEVKDYLEKVKAFEAVQNDPDSYKAWEKKTVHMIGGNDANIVGTLRNYMNSYAATISDTLVGANVSTYERLNNPNTAANNAEIQSAVKEGVGLINYFGHSSAVSIDFNLNNPNELAMTQGRYPVFIANGCKASEFFDLNTLRYGQRRLTLSERFVLPKDKGAIAFLSSTTVGILQYLDRFTSRWYKAAGTTQYGKTLGEIHQETIRQMMLSYTTFDQNARLTSEEYHLHGDPAIRMYPLIKPDYVIDSSSVLFNPNQPTAADDSVGYQFTIRNEGKASNDTILVKVIRIFPDNSEATIKTLTVPKLGNSQTFTGSFAIRGSRENGRNFLKVEVDYTNKVTESLESNNTATKSVWIEPKGLKPSVPAQYSIVNTWPVELVATTHELKIDSGLFRMEMDTTALFNSPSLYSLEDSSRNGVVRFSPANTLEPGKVYYWRTAQKLNGTLGAWQTSSFTYRPGDGAGFNQEHFYQHTQSTYRAMQLDSDSRRFKFNPKANNLYIIHGIYPTSAGEDLQFSVTPNGSSFIYSACLGQSIIFNVFDSLSFAAFQNPAQVLGTVGGCPPNRPGRTYNYEFRFHSNDNRKKIMDFMDSLPAGQIVVARLVVDPNNDSMLVKYWMNDTVFYGSGNSLYHKFRSVGFYDVDSLTTRRTFSLVYKKGDTTTFRPQWVMSDGLFDLPVMSTDIPMIDTSGSISSPLIGPARSWASMQWRPDPSFSEENGLVTDSIKTYVLGIKNNGTSDTLFALNSLQDFSFDGGNAVDANVYPYMKLVQQTNDADNATPVQLNYWRVYYQPAAEGSLAPEELFYLGNKESGSRTDTLQLYRDSLHFKVAFRNLSAVAYADSLQVQVQLEDSLGNITPVTSYKARALAGGDSIQVYAYMPLTNQQMVGSRKLRVSVNGQGQQPEAELS
ncbi:MAG TPA: C25 family cysteine peptidase, partial [Phnomibacter sp.]|nr:C25 family cysteine peptidase [Phnomibacter sp.]